MAHSSIKRARIGFNVFIQIITLFAIVVMLNLFAFNHYQRWDISRDHSHTLSEQTRSILANLKKDVDFIVFFTGNPDIARDTNDLLDAYVHASGRKVRVEVINPYLNLTRAREVASKYKLGASENVIIVDSDGRSKLVNASEMGEYEPALSPLNPPHLKAFTGEQALTSALIELSEQGSNKIYAISGHGEPAIDGDSLDDLRLLIERQNITFETLKLGEIDLIPEDAKMLLIIGPKYDFNEHDLALLRAYWEKKGRLLALLDPASATPNLKSFFTEQGVTVNDDRVLRTVPFGKVTGVLKEISADFLPGSPITKQLEGVNTLFLGGTQSLTLDPEGVKEQHIRLTPLIRASKGFWGEKHFDINAAGNSIYFDPKEDTLMPVIAAAVEKGALSDDRVQLGTSRLIVVGNSSFVDSSANAMPSTDFILGGVNWLINREPLIGITPKTVQQFSLNLNQSQISSLSLLVLIVIPGCAAALGFLTWLKRRR